MVIASSVVPNNGDNAISTALGDPYNPTTGVQGVKTIQIQLSVSCPWSACSFSDTLNVSCLHVFVGSTALTRYLFHVVRGLRL